MKELPKEDYYGVLRLPPGSSEAIVRQPRSLRGAHRPGAAGLADRVVKLL